MRKLPEGEAADFPLRLPSRFLPFLSLAASAREESTKASEGVWGTNRWLVPQGVLLEFLK